MKPIVVLYYHRILPFKGYDIDIRTFEWQLSYISKRFDIIGAEELIGVLNSKKLRRPSVLLTFDDGFADNFVYAYPILKKYNAKAVIFPATSKIQNSDNARCTLEDYWNGRVEFKNLFVPNREETSLYDSLCGNYRDFLSWKELDIMKKSGVFEIGSHGHMHSKIFTSESVKDFYHKDANIHWSFIYANSSDLSIGSPVFEMQSSLASNAFIPDDDFKKYTKAIFNKIYDRTHNYSKARAEALNEINRYKNRGMAESDKDFENRVFKELALSKRLIKEQLSVDVKLLSWPWGEYSKKSIEIAQKVGFELCFTTKKRAFIDDDICRIGRIKAADKKSRFARKLFFNSNTVFARLYRGMHS